MRTKLPGRAISAEAETRELTVLIAVKNRPMKLMTMTNIETFLEERL